MNDLDIGPFFHGTIADLRVGDLLTPGFMSSYDGQVVMNHIYFTALPKEAGLAAEMSRGAGKPGSRVSMSWNPPATSRTTRTSPTKSSLAIRPGITGAGIP